MISVGGGRASRCGVGHAGGVWTAVRVHRTVISVAPDNTAALEGVRLQMGKGMAHAMILLLLVVVASYVLLLFWSRATERTAT